MAHRAQEAKANKAAGHWVENYYAAYDSANKAQKMPDFYLPEARIVWNGNGIQGQQEIQQLFATMPRSRHEVQAFDAHMIPGSINTTKPLPSLSLAVTGHVRYQESAFPPNWRMPGTSSVTPGDDPELLPRVFSQSFVLHPTAEGAYKATADVFRFVG